MVLNINDTLPFGKFKNFQIGFILDKLTPSVLDYMLWWNKTVQTHTFNQDIVKVLKKKQKYYDKIKSEYEREESIRDKSYDNPQPNKKINKGWDLPTDDKPLESYLYN